MSAAKYHLITYGCQMNKSDSERLVSILRQCGMVEVARPEEADFVLLNSCSVRQTAEDRVFGQVRICARQRERGSGPAVIGVTGCMAGRDTDGALRRKLPEVDLFFPTRDMVMLPRWLSELGVIAPSEIELPSSYLEVTPAYNNSFQAFVPIQTGCNNFCTYCVVPYARGRETNRPAAEIIAEVRRLAEQGVVEVTLLGQAVNSYLAPEERAAFSAANPYSNHFAALLWELNQLPGLRRIHFTAPHPRHMTDEVIDALALPKQVNLLHLPVQAGSDQVLQKMNRHHTRADFLEVIRKVRERRPEICLATDIIVGFCGESEAMFAETVFLYKEVGFDIAYLAMYSPRSGTPAWRAFADDVPHAEKKRRWRELHRLMEEIVLAKNQKYVGREVEVLVSECNDGVCSGNSRELKLVRFAGGPELVGQTAMVRVDQAHEWVLDGTLSSGNL